MLLLTSRRARWAVALPVLYVASFGPACWLTSHTQVGNKRLPTIYRPPLAAMQIEKSHRAQLSMPLLAVSWMEGRTERLPHQPVGVLSCYSLLGAAASWHSHYLGVYLMRHGKIVHLGDESWDWSDTREPPI